MAEEKQQGVLKAWSPTSKKWQTEKVYPDFVRLTPAEFKKAVKAKGWNYRALAKYWNLSAVRVSQIARNQDRPHYYDDAVRGLPEVGKTAEK